MKAPCLTGNLKGEVPKLLGGRRLDSTEIPKVRCENFWGKDALTQTNFQRRGAKNSGGVRFESKDISKAGCKNCWGGGALTQRKFQRRDAKIAQEEDASLKKLGTERLIELVGFRRKASITPFGEKAPHLNKPHRRKTQFHPHLAPPQSCYPISRQMSSPACR